MINTKLVIFEGIPGSGKTTTSQLLYKHFLENGIQANSYIEGCKHPIDLPFYAYLTFSEYEAMILKFHEQAQWLQDNSIKEDDYVLIPYKIPEPHPWDENLVEYLSSKEFCYSKKPVVPFETFKKVFYRRFKRYVNKMISKSEVTIFESVLMQHQIHDINRLYPHVKDYEIIEYLKALAHIISPLNPVLFYISQNSVKDSLERTAVIRSKTKWSREETIAYYEKRKALELEVIKSIPFQNMVLNNTDYHWDGMFNTILLTLLSDQ